MPSITCPSPFGPVTLWQEGAEVARLTWDAGPDDPTGLLRDAAAQLAAYFAGARRGFDLPLALGSGRTGAFLRALVAIPFGATRSYGDLARQLGTSAQDVGQMCGQNRLPILIPCHRVLGARGLGGFSAPGGIETKVALLRHEGAAGLLI
jgi:O-6-methylguanine DNA methyltransferase